MTYLPPVDEQMSDRARRLLGTLVDDLMRLGEVRLGLAWTGPRPEIKLEAGGLFGAPAVELAWAVTRASGFAVCAGCGAVYPPSRPVRGKRNYCQTCLGNGVPVRDAQRDRRRRQANSKQPGIKGSGAAR